MVSTTCSWVIEAGKQVEGQDMPVALLSVHYNRSSQARLPGRRRRKREVHWAKMSIVRQSGTMPLSGQLNRSSADSIRSVHKRVSESVSTNQCTVYIYFGLLHSTKCNRKGSSQIEEEKWQGKWRLSRLPKPVTSQGQWEQWAHMWVIMRRPFCRMKKEK